MIFASIGSLLPFDRLVMAVDEWARDNPGEQVFIQIGDGAYEPRHCPWTRILPAVEHRARLKSSSLFVAHAGMGSILQAMEEGKQILIMPRREASREHTTDHQMHTAERFGARQGVRVELDAEGLKAAITELLRSPLQMGTFSGRASSELLGNLSSYLRASLL